MQCHCDAEKERHLEGVKRCESRAFDKEKYVEFLGNGARD